VALATAVEDATASGDFCTLHERQDTGEQSGGAASLPKEASLLGLPAELRNIIYIYAVVEPDLDHTGRLGRPGHEHIIEVDETNHRQPALLRTSRQLRDEASKVYYANHYWAVTMPKAKLTPQRDHWIFHEPAKYGFDTIPWTYIDAGEWSDECWPNLISWLRLFHAGLVKAQLGNPAYPDE
jgi:hypothetical protein